MHASGLTELVGREEELELLLRRWSKAKTGEGQVVLLSGEPGIGKSRLTAALLERLATSRTRACAISARHSTPTARFTRSSAKWSAPLDLRTKTTAQAKAGQTRCPAGAEFYDAREDAALFAEMLSLPNDGRYPTLELTAPAAQAEDAGRRSPRQLEALARRNPVLMIFEDVHWARPDQPGSAWSDVDRLKTLGVLLIVTYRPEFEPPWIGRPYVTALTLNRLGEREIAAMIDVSPATSRCPRVLDRTSSSAQTVFRCSWRK